MAAPAARPSGSADRIYTSADLNALARQSAWAELLQHAEDVAPAERTEAWSDLVAQAAVAWLLEQDPPNSARPPSSARDVVRAVQARELARRYASLRGSSSFRATRGDIIVRAAGACSSRGWRSAERERACTDLVSDLEAVKDPKKSIAAARAAVRTGERALGMAMYRLASESENLCEDSEALEVVMDGRSRPEGSQFHKDAELVFEQCRTRKAKAKALP